MNGIARRALTLVSRPLLTNTDRKVFIPNLKLTRFYSLGATMNERIPFTSDFLFRQFFDEKSWTYTYLLADVNSKDAILIDPGKFTTNCLTFHDCGILCDKNSFGTRST